MTLKTEWLNAVENTKKAQIKVGNHPRFTTIWVVKTPDGVFCRNSTGKQGGWYTALLKNPNVVLKLGNQEYKVLGKPLVYSDELIKSINKAYLKKYANGLNFDTFMAWMFTRKKYWDKTIELTLQ